MVLVLLLLTELVKNLGNGASANGAATFADGELGSLFHSDRVDELDGEGNVVTRHNHIGSGRKGDGSGDVGGAEEELRTIAVEEVGVTAAFFFLQDVGSSGELVVWDDGSWLGKDLTTFDLVMGDTTEKGTNVVAALSELKDLAEHFETGDDGLLGWTDTDDFGFVVELDDTTLDTAGNDGATARDGHDVFDREKEWLVVIADWIDDVGIEGIHELKDGLGCWIIERGGFASFEGGTTDDWEIIPWEVILGEEVTDIHFNEVDKFWVIDHIALVEEDDDLRNANLAGKKDVFAGLWHDTIGGGDDEDSSIHLRSAGDHVLDVVSVPRAVDVSIVTVLGLVFDVGGVDGNTTGSFFWGGIDSAIRHVFGETLHSKNVGNTRGEGGLSVVDVADSTNVNVGKITVKFFFCHCSYPPIDNRFSKLAF